ncbi:MAG: DUF2256 domain-containing protein [Methylophilaceae bacterium]
MPLNKRISFKGNKSNLPIKLCSQCGREMVWRKSWAKNWLQVKYCSAACSKMSKKPTSSEVCSHK